MPAHTYLRVFARPIRSFRPEQIAVPSRLVAVWIPSRSKGAAICLNCRIRSSIQFYSTSSATPPNRPPAAKYASSPVAQGSSRPPEVSQPEPPPAAELPSAADQRRLPLSKRFSTFMDNLQSRVLVASQTLNDLTGYTAIEAIKAANHRLESSLSAAQARLRAARQSYKALNASRSATQREVTTLLARKDTWSPADLERFTTLYRLDHEQEAQITAASAELTEAESEEARLGAALNAGILKRYHEEQVWSDRIRRQSTWGTWGLMGVNVILFLVLQFVAEPWKRNRLMRGIAAEEKGALEELRRELGEVRTTLARMDRDAEMLADAAALGTAVRAEGLTLNKEAAATPVSGAALQAPGPTASWKETLLDPGRWGTGLADLQSDRRISLRMRDVSLIALEGVATGTAIAAGIAILVLRRT